MRQKRSNEDSENEITDTDSVESFDVSLHWLRRQFGRVLEMFIILQFITGAFVFFCGIFFLLWSVVPAASLKAGSYMLLAFFIIGRALLGLVGYYSDNFCLLFSYGSLLLATFVVRTILILVRLKITTSPDDQLHIPPLLMAAPGALETPIEILCSLLECSQAVCAFYLCWIVSKVKSFEKDSDESKINVNIATEIAKYLSDLKSDEKKDSTLDSDAKSDASNEVSSVIQERKASIPVVAEQDRKTPLKGILHHQSNYYSQSVMATDMIPTPSHQPYRQHHQCHSTKQPTMAPVTTSADVEVPDYFNMYRKYPRPHHPRRRRKSSAKPKPEPLESQQQQQQYDSEPMAISDVEENFPVATVDDYHNNNQPDIQNQPQTLQQQQQPPGASEYPYYQNIEQWNYRYENRENYCQNPDYTQQLYSEVHPGLVRAASPIPPTPEMNSPLLYERNPYYGTIGYSENTYASHVLPTMYR